MLSVPHPVHTCACARSCHTIAIVFAGFIAALLGCPSARAADGTWTGGSLANGNWSSALNWLSGTVPGATSGTTNPDIATFNAAIANTWGNTAVNPIVIDANRNIRGINFTGAAGNYFIGATGGNAILLSNGGAIEILYSTNAINAIIGTINAPLVIQGANGTYTFANNTFATRDSNARAGTLVFGGGITGGASGATVLTLSGGNTNANTISGVIANGAATTMALTKRGGGTWTLSGANTYTGGTTVSGGTLQVASGGSITHTSASMVVGSLSGDNGTLNITGGAVSNTTGYLGRNAGSSGTATVSSGTWTNSSDLYVGSSGTGTLNITGGAVSNSTG